MWPKQRIEIEVIDSKWSWFITENKSASDGVAAVEIRKGDK